MHSLSKNRDNINKSTLSPLVIIVPISYYLIGLYGDYVSTYIKRDVEKEVERQNDYLFGEIPKISSDDESKIFKLFSNFQFEHSYTITSILHCLMIKVYLKSITGVILVLFASHIVRFSYCSHAFRHICKGVPLRFDTFV